MLTVAGGGDVISRKAIGKKIQKAVRLPPNHTAMSLLAVILVIGAPALVSTLNDDITYDYIQTRVMYELETTEESLNSYCRIGDEGTLSTPITYVGASMNNGVHSIAINDTSLASQIRYYRVHNIDFDTIKDGGDKVILTSTADISGIRFGALSGMEGVSICERFTNVLNEDGTPSDVWEYTIRPTDMVKFRGDMYTQIYIDIFTKAPLVDFTLETVKSNTVVVSEIIIGATGAALMLCAVLAMPWFGFAPNGRKR